MAPKKILWRLNLKLVANCPLKKKFNFEGCIYEMSQMNRHWLRQIYLYCFYIPELIQLANDVETNPGPGIVDPTKIIAGPYIQQSQGNVQVFGTANAGAQCVAMFLSALVYNLRNLITSSADSVQTMSNGNNMYTTLPQSCKQGFLLLTDLPVMVNLSDINYPMN